MEETLKLILEKISNMDQKIGNMDERISNMDERISFLEQGQKEMKQNIEQRLDKIDMAIEHSLEPKISALFYARDISLHTDESIINDVKEVKEDISHLEKAIIRNTADIVDLKDYRKQNDKLKK